MKNKYGFTLVELLAVIAIMAILVIIALPNVLELFQETKENSFRTELKTIYKAAQQSWIQDAFSDDGGKIYAKCSNCSNSLALSGGDEIEYYIKLNNNGKVTEYCAKNSTYQYYYKGDPINAEEINDVSKIAESTDMKVKIDNNSCKNENAVPQNIQICYYEDLFEIDSSYRRTKTCRDDKTISECIGDNRYTHFYPINNNSSSEFDACKASIKSSNTRDYTTIYNCFSSAPHYDTCVRSITPTVGSWTSDFRYEDALSGCNLREDFHRNVALTDLVLPATSGCYAPTKFSTTCLDGDSEVEVYDKKKKKKLKKKLKDVTYDDLILCWDFVKGEFTYAKPLWIMKPELVESYIILEFSDGSILKVMGDHRIYNLDTQMFTSCKSDKASPIGMRTINSKGEIITLVKRKIYNEPAMAYNVILDKQINLYANGLLTSRGLNNLYPINNMKFVKEDRKVFTREELKEIPDEYFYGLNLGETPRTFMGDEERTKAQLVLFVERSINTKM